MTQRAITLQNGTVYADADNVRRAGASLLFEAGPHRSAQEVPFEFVESIEPPLEPAAPAAVTEAAPAAAPAPASTAPAGDGGAGPLAEDRRQADEPHKVDRRVSDYTVAELTEHAAVETDAAALQQLLDDEALTEGGGRKGVLTALADRIAELAAASGSAQ